MVAVDWYFDFVSPYSYFSSLQLSTLAAEVQIRYHPVLFAALLNHWEHKGPAEIPPKRQWTYRWCTWWAERQRIPFRMPAVHPFNPLPYLRLAHAAQCAPDAIHTIFHALWTTGADPRDPSLIEESAGKLGLSTTRIEDPPVKQALRECTQEAITAGVFGVPTFQADGQLFWGSDSMSFLQDYLDDPSLFEGPEMQRASSLPAGATRIP